MKFLVPVVILIGGAAIIGWVSSLIFGDNAIGLLVSGITGLAWGFYVTKKSIDWR